MSFLLGALGGVGRALLPAAGGFLLDTIKSFIPTARSAGGGAGGTAMDYLVNKGINAAFDGVQKFAQSSSIARKMPIIAGMASDAAGAIKDRLSGGYKDMMMQIDQDSVEKRR